MCLVFCFYVSCFMLFFYFIVASCCFKTYFVKNIYEYHPVMRSNFMHNINVHQCCGVNFAVINELNCQETLLRCV